MKRQGFAVPTQRPPKPPSHATDAQRDTHPSPRSDAHDPRIFTQLASGLVRAPDDHVVGLTATHPLTLFARPAAPMHISLYRQPSKTWVGNLCARRYFERLVAQWRSSAALASNPRAREAFAQLQEVLLSPPTQQLGVASLREALQRLSEALDPHSPWRDQRSPLPDLHALVNTALGTDDPDVRPNVRALAGILQEALENPDSTIDIGSVDAEDLECFTELGAMANFLGSRLLLDPPVTSVTLCAALESLPRFVSRFPTLQTLVLPDYLSDDIDLSGLAALQAVHFGGDTPTRLHALMPPGRTVELLDEEGNAIPLAGADPVATDP